MSAADRALRFGAETARLEGAVKRFIAFASEGDVKRMLLEGLTVQDALERVAKTVTGTETV